MEFITRHPKSNKYNTILVVVDRLTKMVHYIPTQKDTPSEKVACLYFNNIFLYSLQDSVVSNPDT